MADGPETVVDMVQHAGPGPGQIVFTEEIKKRLFEISQFIRRESLAEQQFREALGNAPNAIQALRACPAAFRSFGPKAYYLYRSSTVSGILF